MNDKYYYWKLDGIDCGWEMPSAHWIKRLPLIRHIRAIRAIRRVDVYDRFWCSMAINPTGYSLNPTGYSLWVIYGIWHGLEPPHD